MLKQYLKQLVNLDSLSVEQAKEAAIRMLMADPIEVAALFSLLQAKGVNANELLGFAEALQSLAKPLSITSPFVDIVGTGGDQAGTVNISTASALLAAASGVLVVKHGNRSSSSFGSADFMEALGARLDLEGVEIERLLKKTNFAFCFAPKFHPALQQLRSLRKAIQIPTVLNLVAPLMHPAKADHLVLGVYRDDLVFPVAEALRRLGTKRSLVFSNYGLDELSCLGVCRALLVTADAIDSIEIDPEQLGLSLCTLEDLKGGSLEENKQRLIRTLSGERTALSDTLILNAAAAIYLYHASDSFLEAISLARKTLQTGAALHLIEDYCKESQRIMKKEVPHGSVGATKKSLKTALKKDKVAILAEIKRASPSKGKIAEIPDAAKQALLYVETGASAISVLTNGAFQGSLDDLRLVSHALRDTDVPVLRKDFIRTAEQIREAKEAGADAVLLIVSVLKERTKEMLTFVHEMGMEALVEVHTKEELAIAIDANAQIIGVNQRDLSDFSMHPETFKEMAPLLPKGCISVAESGMRDTKEATLLGYDAVLIGEAFSRGALCQR